METLLARKAVTENPIAIDDDVQLQLINDPAVPQFGSFNQFQTAAVNNFSGLQQHPVQNSNLTTAGDNAAQNAEVLIENTNSHWINHRWRPMMGWMYMAVCVCDFIVFPILWSVLQAVSKGQVTQQWQPLTLQGAGLFHIAMGAVLGIAAYGRTKEKIEGMVK